MVTAKWRCVACGTRFHEIDVRDRYMSEDAPHWIRSAVMPVAVADHQRQAHRCTYGRLDLMVPFEDQRVGKAKVH
jgi:hypothetical protein